MPETISASLAAWRKKYPEGKITTTAMTVGGKQYNLPSIKTNAKGNWKQFIKFIQAWKTNPTIDNFIKLNEKLDKGAQEISRDFRKWLRKEPLGYRSGLPGGSQTIKAFESINKNLNLNAKQIKEIKTYTKPVVDAALFRIKALPASTETKLEASAEMVKRINKVFKTNPDISLNGLAAKLNGRAYAMAGNEGRLAMATEASNGVAKYLEAIEPKKGTGRIIKNWVPPTGKNKDKIIKNILEGTEGGFRFQEGTLRRYKFNIRDALLKNPQFTSENLRRKLTKLGATVDEAVGLSATYKAAPGYTELIQLLPDETNKAKRYLDQRFKIVLDKATKGDFSGVKEFNKLSEQFRKKWKGVDTPLLRPGGDPKALVANFEFLSPGAQKNILELSKGPKGFAIETEALPWGEMGTRVAELKKNESAFKKFLKVISKSPTACRRILDFQVGGAAQTCAAAVRADPVGTAEKISKLEVTGGALGKVKNAATTFLGTLGKFGTKAAPLAAIAAVGAVAEPLVKQFVIDDPNTYLTNEDQQKGMLLSLLEREPPKVDEEILKWQYPGLGAATAAGAIPGAGAVYKARRSGVPLDKSIGPLKEVGKTRAALGITGVLGKALGASFSPLAVAATTPLSIAAERKGGTEWGDIATDPSHWIGPAFASSGAEMASKGIKNPMLLRALRLGMSSRALMLGSRFLGLPGLALTGGMWAYDKWKKRDKDKEFELRRYRDDDDE